MDSRVSGSSGDLGIGRSSGGTVAVATERNSLVSMATESEEVVSISTGENDEKGPDENQENIPLTISMATVMEDFLKCPLSSSTNQRLGDGRPILARRLLETNNTIRSRSVDARKTD